MKTKPRTVPVKFYGGRKFMSGQVLTKLSQVTAALKAHRWLMVKSKPAHPNAIRAMSFCRIQHLIENRGLRHVIRNPEAPFLWEIQQPYPNILQAHSGEWPEDLSVGNMDRDELVKQIQETNSLQRQRNRCPKAPLKIIFTQDISPRS